MVDIEYSPIKSIVVHEIVSMHIDDLIRERITPAGSVPLYWCDSILFSFSSAPMSRKILDDYLNGTIHWMEVHYTDLGDYSSMLELKDEDYGGTAKVRVIDTSASNLHKEFIKWLKKSRQ